MLAERIAAVGNKVGRRAQAVASREEPPTKKGTRALRKMFIVASSPKRGASDLRRRPKSASARSRCAPIQAAPSTGSVPMLPRHR